MSGCKSPNSNYGWETDGVNQYVKLMQAVREDRAADGGMMEGKYRESKKASTGSGGNSYDISTGKGTKRKHDSRIALFDFEMIGGGDA